MKFCINVKEMSGSFTLQPDEARLFVSNVCLDGVSKNRSFQIVMSGRVSVGQADGHWALSEVYRLVNLFEKPVHNDVRCFSCFFAKFIKFPAPILSGKFEFTSGKCEENVREFWSVLTV